MAEITVAMLRAELDTAFEMITKLSNNGARMAETLSKSHSKLMSQIEIARGETIIVLKIVAQVLARECLLDQNPVKRLEAMIAPLILAEKTFAPDPGAESLRTLLAEAGLPAPSIEEKEQEERDTAISESYGSFAQLIRKEALEIVNSVRR